MDFNIFSPGNPNNFPLIPIEQQVGAKTKYGRLVLNDPRSREHPLSAKLPKRLSQEEKKRTSRKWRSRYQADQKETSQCTAYALMHIWEMEPINHPRSYGKWKGKPYPIIPQRTLYCEAQNVDPWEGGCGARDSQDAYDGTSLTAMMQVAKNRELVISYDWEYENVDNVIQALLYKSPVIVGTNFYRGMELRPNDRNTPSGLMEATGAIIGGHSYVLDEVDLRPKRHGYEIGVFNSWGPEWGLSGRGYMSIETLERLMKEEGEICLIEEAP